jgi:VanZ family protein
MAQHERINAKGSWFWPVLLATTVFFASGQGAVAAPDIVSIDKVGHFAVFGLLAILIARTQPRKRWWWGFVIASAYGAADEWRQSFTPGRFVEFGDWIADTLGAAVGVAVYARWSRFRNALETKLIPRRVPPVAKPPAIVPDSR